MVYKLNSLEKEQKDGEEFGQNGSYRLPNAVF